MSKNSKSGFTILELALAMAFISFLLLTIGFSIIQISLVYQKGITIKVVNNTGRELVDEFSRTILSSRYEPYIDEEGKSHFEYTYTESYRDIGVDGASVPVHGAFCMGDYSYIWNTGYALNYSGPENVKATFKLYKNPDETQYLIYGDEEDSTGEYQGDLRLLRVNDTSREVCRNFAEDSQSAPNDYWASFKTTNPVELLSASESDLVLYNLVFYEPTLNERTGDALFSGSFILGTLGGGADITASGNFCTDKPDNLNTDFFYCQLNKFNFAIRATGGLNI